MIAVLFFFYYRLYLASMHHNENASQEQATTSAVQAKSGEGVVKAVKTDPTFSKIVKYNLETHAHIRLQIVMATFISMLMLYLPDYMTS